MSLLLLTSLFACGDQGVTVHNTDPEVVWITPVAGQLLGSGQPITLVARVSDAETLDPTSLALVWGSSLEGELDGTETWDGDQVSLALDGLAEGTHLLSLVAYDPREAEGSDEVTVEVVADAVPAVVFDSPTDGSRALLGEPVLVQVTASDADEPALEDLVLTWSGPEGLDAVAPIHPTSDGTAAFTLDGLALGHHSLTVVVSDSLGATAQALVQLEVAEGDQDGDGHVAWDLGGDDCDDDDDAIHPDAEEVCDEVDNDCDDAIDEGVGTWYPDADGDGFGDPDAPIDTCEQPSDAVADGTDCDDLEPTAWPGNVEDCDDNVDNDCNGRVNDGCSVDLGDVTSVLFGSAANDRLGAVASVGDVDGDGTDELLVGAPYDATVMTYGGAVYLHSPPDPGASDAWADAEAVWTASSDLSTGYLGWTVAAGGDYDGDGVPDGLAGLPYLDTPDGDSGGAVVLSGTRTGTTSGEQALAQLDGSESGHNCGLGLAFAGDVDSDGLDDVLVGCPGSGTGRAYLVRGGQAVGLDLETGAEAVLIGIDGGDAFGRSVSGVGDLDGDGLPETLVGAPDADLGGNAAGAAYLFSQPSGDTWAAYDAVATYTGEADGDRAGLGVAGVGDLDGDGLDDLAIAAPGESTAGIEAGAVYVVLGSASPGDVDLKLADRKWTGPAEWAGGSEAWAFAAGDLDGDGGRDLVIGAPTVDETATQAGAVYIFAGPPAGSGSLTDADFQYLGAADGDQAGMDLAVGDYDGDGLDDVAVGMTGDDLGGHQAGGVAVIYGDLLGGG